MSLTVGSQRRLTYDVVDANGAPTNPVTATLALVSPDGAPVVPAPVIVLPPVVTGHLTFDYTTAQAGRYTGFWSTTSPVTTGAFTFNVAPAESGALMSISEAKRYLNEPDADSSNDLEIGEFLNVVTGIVEQFVGPVIPRTVIERCEGGGRGIALRHGPVIEITSVKPWTNYGETIALTDIRLDPITWVIERRSGIPFRMGPYEVTFLAGRQIVTPAILHGAKAVLDHLWETQRGSSMVGPRSVTEDDAAFNFRGTTWTLPRSVLEILQSEAIGGQIG